MRVLVTFVALIGALLLVAWATCQLQPACRAALPDHDAGDPPIGWPAR